MGVTYCGGSRIPGIMRIMQALMARCTLPDDGAFCGKGSSRVRADVWLQSSMPFHTIATCLLYSFGYLCGRFLFADPPSVTMFLTVVVLCIVVKIKALCVPPVHLLVVVGAFSELTLGTTACGWRCSDIGRYKENVFR